MKNFLLESMLLVSHRERKAKKIEFHPRITIIKGANDTGKSSLIKSIYRGFGAEPPKIHQKWKDANVASLIYFRVKNERFAILRSAGEYSIFDANKKLLNSYSSVTNELAPALANLLGFQLRILNREHTPSIPPPAYFFLPFYIDQDEGWIKPWQSFNKLSQFANWKQPVASYHFGLRPDQWYKLDAKKHAVAEKKEIPEKEIAALEKLERKTRNQLTRVDFDIDISAFKAEIMRLLNICNDLCRKEEEYRQRVVELRTEKIRLEAQIEIVTRTRDELSADYTYAVEQQGLFVSCPMCGQEYENSFAERFEIAKDEETCSDLLQLLQADLRKVNAEIQKTHSSLSVNSKEKEEINTILSAKQGAVILSDLVKIAGKKELLSHLETEIATQKDILEGIDKELGSIKREMDKYDNKDHRSSILKQYEQVFRQNASVLNVHGLSENVFTRIDAKIEETGSDQPRAVLAYQFSVLDAIARKSDATFCPIVIDAPNQQEQDQENLKRILQFIPQCCPEGSQLVLGLVDDAGFQFDGKTIELKDKFSLLDQEAYLEAAEEIRHHENLQIKAKFD
ncbi:MAG: hypothetical protein EKK71_13325 [Candidatus Competibacteraceae bacterium]|nr:MAG: hypothetical protein EKK71_13325 [Candidatus Competibacteraceae bacterium]